MYLLFRPDGSSSDWNFQVPSVSFSCPEDDVTLWSWFTFSFIQPMLDLATSRTLNDTDIWMLSPFFQHKVIFTKYLEYRSQYVLL